MRIGARLYYLTPGGGRRWKLSNRSDDAMHKAINSVRNGEGGVKM